MMMNGYIIPTVEQHEKEFVMLEIIGRPCIDDMIFSYFIIKNLVKAGSIFYPHGFMKYVLNKEFGTKVIQYLKDRGLYNFITFDPRSVHLPDVAQFYINNSISKDANGKEIDEIRSNVNGMEVIVVHGDMRTIFLFPPQ